MPTLDAVAEAPTAQTSELPPWKRSWFYCAPGEWPVLVWMILIHVAGLAGLILLPLPSWQILLAAFALAFIGGLGTTVCYHRALTHKGVVLNPIVEQILIFFAQFNGSGSPRSWVANHRHHHAHSDEPDDISSPIQGGFWWSHLRWLWQSPAASPEKYCKDMNSFRYRFWTKAQVPVLVSSFFVGIPVGYLCGFPVAVTWLWMGPLRVLWSLHAQCTINSICHLGHISPDKDSSRNVWWLSFIHVGQGENWHANHHDHQTDPRLGQTAWQIDVGWWTIRALEFCRLAHVKRTTRDMQAAAA